MNHRRPSRRNLCARIGSVVTAVIHNYIFINTIDKYQPLITEPRNAGLLSTAARGGAHAEVAADGAKTSIAPSPRELRAKKPGGRLTGRMSSSCGNTTIRTQHEMVPTACLIFRIHKRFATCAPLTKGSNPEIAHNHSNATNNDCGATIARAILNINHNNNPPERRRGVLGRGHERQRVPRELRAGSTRKRGGKVNNFISWDCLWFMVAYSNYYRVTMPLIFNKIET